MTREQLKDILPHREPMLLLDSCEKTADGRAVGTYLVRGDEFFLQGHFPDNPVVPGVIQCEMCAQACCMLFAEELKNKLPVYTGIKEAKFKRMVRPGDTLRFECELVRVKGPFCFTKGRALIGEEVAMSGEFSFALLAR